MNRQTRFNDFVMGGVLFVVALSLTSCNPSKLVYRVSGTVKEAEVTCTDGNSKSQTQTVTLPWETSLSVGSKASFSLQATNKAGQGTIGCSV